VTQQLRQEAYELLCRIMEAMLSRPDAQCLARLRRVRWRAERRYWRRRERDEPSGNQTPAWFYRTANAGY